MENKLHFVSSLPRSGSTLLMNILGQHPNHYVTPTSGLIELFIGMVNSWKNPVEFKAEGLDKIKPRVKNALKGILHGYFEDEFSKGMTVFDKSRGWFRYVEQIEDVLGHKIKVICTVRDPRSIAASFEKLYRNGEIDWQYQNQNADLFVKEQTLVGRCQLWFSDGGMIAFPINGLRDLIMRKPDRLIVVPYNLLISNPQEVIKDLSSELGLTEYDYNFDNIKQVTREDDTYYGMKLHKIRNKVEPVKDDWEKILPEELASSIEQNYRDIIEMSESDSIFVGDPE